MKLKADRRSLLIAGGVVAAVIALWLAIGGRGSKLAPERLTPLASELEGVRGVYLYFGVPGSDDVAAEYRDVVVKDREADRVRAIYRELLSGSIGSYESPFPDGVELLNAYYTSRGALYLDWNQAMVKEFQGGSGRERRPRTSSQRARGRPTRARHPSGPGPRPVLRPRRPGPPAARPLSSWCSSCPGSGTAGIIPRAADAP